MEIKKYKLLKGNKYKIILDETEIILYEDIIIKNNILLKKEITNEEITNYLKENNYYESYYETLKFLNLKIRSAKEIEMFLNKKELTKQDKINIIDKLTKEGYVNDDMFAKCYINDQINLKNDGPYKIKKDLEKLGIEEKIINKNIIIFTETLEQEKIEKYINKQIKLNNKQSVFNMKNKILNNLLNLGYNKQIILDNLEKIKFNEEDYFKKEYEKAYNKLSKKYSGKELEYKIKQKLYQKGFF